MSAEVEWFTFTFWPLYPLQKVTSTHWIRTDWVRGPVWIGA